MPLHLSFAFGTRPELIKLAPLILRAQDDPAIDVEVIFSAQHDELVRDSLEFFGIAVDHRLEMMVPGQSLARMLSRGVQQIDAVLSDGRPRHAMVVQGDTTTVLAAALAAFSHRIPVAHVEAGLRSFDLQQPFPEEGNRQLTSRVTRWHFAPTAASAANLRAENIAEADIVVTGNTVVDAVHMTRARLKDPAVRAQPESKLADMGVNTEVLANCILVTAHRRENFDGGIADICRAVRRLSLAHPTVHFLWPVHKNPKVLDVVNRELANLENVHRLPPLDYPTLMVVIESARFVLTDSGGLQEESPSFRKPVLVLRDLTERPEVIDCGAGKIVGTDVETIVRECERLLTEEDSYLAMANAPNPFGDGRACERILERIKRDLVQVASANDALPRNL